MFQKSNEQQARLTTTEARQAVSVGMRYVLAAGLLLAVAAGIMVYLAVFH